MAFAERFMLRLFLLAPMRTVLSLIAIWWFASSVYGVGVTGYLNGARHLMELEPDGWVYAKNFDGHGGKSGFQSGPITVGSPGITAQLINLAKQFPEWQRPSPRYDKVNPGFVTFRGPTEYIVCVRHWLIFSVFAIFKLRLELKHRSVSQSAHEA